MSDRLRERLNAILPRVTSDEFLSGSGLGNELAFYVFDYPAEEELRVREDVAFLVEQIPKRRPGMRVHHVNLFDLVIDHLKARNLLDKATAMQQKEGDQKLLERLKPILDPEKLAPVFVEAAKPSECELVLVTGIGSVWPVLRSHTLLNNLHARMGETPLVMFYPGKYDGLSLRLFNKVESNNYYRALPRSTSSPVSRSSPRAARPLPVLKSRWSTSSRTHSPRWGCSSVSTASR